MKEKKIKSLQDFYLYELAFSNKYINLNNCYDPIITHYTSLEGFMGIVKNKFVWASSIECLNDISERLNINEIFNEVIEELIKEDMFFDKFKNLDIENYYFTIFEEEGIIKSHKISNPEIFVISLSLVEDCLSMWNYYTKNNIGEGYALSFYKNIDNIYGNKKFLVQEYPLIYNNKSKKELIKSILRKCKIFYNGQEDDILLKYIKQHIFARLTDVYKNEKFEHEKEYRILIVQDKENREFEVKLREKNGLTIPYIEFPLNKIGHLAFVRISPYLKDKNLTVACILNENGFSNVEVKNSKIPIRY